MRVMGEIITRMMGEIIMRVRGEIIMRGDIAVRSKKISKKTLEKLSIIEFKEIHRNNIRRFFIEATREIIDEHGIEGVSIRRIAKQTGYNSATIYNYFGSLDSLISLALMKYFREYLTALSKNVKEDGNPKENFYTIWEYFFDTCFEQPKIFYYLFFKNRKEPLNEIVRTYYELFPEEAILHPSVVSRMLSGRDIYQRNMHVLQPLVPSGALAPERLEIVNDVLVSYYKTILEQKCDLGYDANDTGLKSRFFSVMDLLL